MASGKCQLATYGVFIFPPKVIFDMPFIYWIFLSSMALFHWSYRCISLVPWSYLSKKPFRIIQKKIYTDHTYQPMTIHLSVLLNISNFFSFLFSYYLLLLSISSLYFSISLQYSKLIYSGIGSFSCFLRPFLFPFLHYPQPLTLTQFLVPSSYYIFYSLSIHLLLTSTTRPLCQHHMLFCCFCRER